MPPESSALPLSAYLGSITETVDQFRCDFAKWEQDFESLLGELDSLARLDTLSHERAAATDSAQRQFETLDTALSKQRQEFGERQDDLARDVGDLRQIVDQQVKLFAAWINATTQKPTSTQRSHKAAKPTDAVLDDILSQLADAQATEETGA